MGKMVPSTQVAAEVVVLAASLAAVMLGVVGLGWYL
jgi:hypothetical protein